MAGKCPVPHPSPAGNLAVAARRPTSAEPPVFSPVPSPIPVGDGERASVLFHMILRRLLDRCPASKASTPWGTSREQNRAVRVAKLAMSAVIRALETGETRGFMKAVIDADTQQILGAAVLGAEGGEIMMVIQVAMLGKLPYTAMANAIFTHALLAEGLNSLFMTLDAQAMVRAFLDPWCGILVCAAAG